MVKRNYFIFRDLTGYSDAARDRLRNELNKLHFEYSECELGGGLDIHQIIVLLSTHEF